MDPSAQSGLAQETRSNPEPQGSIFSFKLELTSPFLRRGTPVGIRSQLPESIAPKDYVSISMIEYERFICMISVCQIFTVVITGRMNSAVRQRNLMNLRCVRTMFSAIAALLITTIGFGSQPTQQQALDYAKSVVLVKRVVQGDHIHAYVKEVWRLSSDVETPPVVGSEYGEAIPYDSRMKNPERDAIVFGFGSDRPKGLTMTWRIQVNEHGEVPSFTKEEYFDRLVQTSGAPLFDTRLVPMTMAEVRKAVKKARQRPEANRVP